MKKLSLEDIPSQFAGYFDITEASAQVILSIAIMFMILLPALYLSKADRTVSFIAIFFSLALCVGIGWLPFWMLIIVVTIIALGLARMGSNFVGGD